LNLTIVIYAIVEPSSAELYNAVLVDTPLAPFFESCINEQDLDEMNIEIIRNTLYKSYLESFYEFCKQVRLEELSTKR
jgi:V-type H+-transporting ATPase subunit d